MGSKGTLLIRRSDPMVRFLLLFLVLFSCKKDPVVMDVRSNPKSILGVLDGNNHKGICQVGEFHTALSLADDAPPDLMAQIQGLPSYKEWEVGLPRDWVVQKSPKQPPWRGDDPFHRIDIGFAHRTEQKIICDTRGLLLFYPEDRSLEIRPNPKSLPNFDLPKTPLNWEFDPTKEIIEAYKRVLREDSLRMDSSELPLYEKEPCLYPDATLSLLEPAFLVKFYVGSTPVEALITEGRLIRAQGLALQGVGHIQAFDPDKKEERALKTITVSSMEDGGFLCSDTFTTSVPKNRPLAFDRGLSFVYDPTDVQFQEASLFSNAHSMWGYLESLGFKNWAGSQIEIYLQEDLPNGPSYVNPDINNSLLTPRIYVTQSTGKLGLDNLSTDLDVVGHELVHHAVSQYVGVEKEDENRTLHEAIADSFVFLKTNNPCLGETICENTKVCMTSQCLRSGDNDLNFEKQPYLGYAWHKKSQLISGLIWDLRSLKDIGKITTYSVRQLSRTTDYREFLGGLIKGVQHYGDKDQVCQVVQAIKNRGLLSKITPPDGCLTPGAGGE
jgi:hypothetical protein